MQTTRRSIWVFAFVAFVFSTAATHSDVASYSVCKTVYFHQTNSTPPSAPDAPNTYNFTTRLALDGNANYEVNDAAVVSTTGDTYYCRSNSPALLSYTTAYYQAKTDFDAAFPSDIYQVYIDDFNDFGWLTFPINELYPQEIPSFNSATWNSLQSVDPARTLRLQWNNFAGDPNANNSYVSLQILDAASGACVYQNDAMPPDMDGITIPRNILKYGSVYRIQVGFVNSTTQDFAFDNGAPGTVSFGRLTYANFATIGPTLKISAASNEVVLNWPASATNYNLEGSPQFTPATWTAIASQPPTNGEFYRLVAQNSSPSAFYRLHRNFTPPIPAQTNLVIDGDSLFSVNNFIPNWTPSFSVPGVVLADNAIGGSDIGGLVSRYPVRDHPFAPHSTGVPGIFILEGGHNDINNYIPPSPPDEIFSDAATILGSAAEDGFSNVLCTISASSYIYLDPNKESIRQSYNGMVRTNAGTFNYAVLDLDTLLPANTGDTYFRQADGLHFSLATEQEIAEYMPDFLGFAPAPSPTNALASSPAFPSNGMIADAIAANNWVFYGNLTTIPGLVGNAVSFDGSTQFMALWPCKFNLGAGSFSGAFWAEWDDTSGKQGLMGQYFDGDGKGCFEVRSRNGILEISTGGGCGMCWGTPLEEGIWYFIAFSYDAESQTMDLSVNGSLPMRSTMTPPCANSVYPLTIGAANCNGAVGSAPANFFNGRLDAVTLWTRKLNISEYQAGYNLGLGRQIP